MKFVFILDNLDSINIDKDTSLAIIREAIARNHQVFVMHQEDLAWKSNQAVGFTSSLSLSNHTGNNQTWYQIEKAIETPLQTFDAVLLRKDPPFDMEYVYSTYLLELAEEQGAYVINSPRAIRDYNEKFSIAKYSEFTAPTLVTKNTRLVREFLKEHQEIIMKPLDGMGGTGVFRVNQTDPNFSVILETLTHHGTRTIMTQRFIPEISAGDKRIILIAGKAVPYALARIPKLGETRGNLAAGGTGITQPLTKRDQEIADTLGPILFDQGLMLVGLDVIGDYLTEINVTSPTGMQEITKQTGFDVAGMMLNTLEKAVKNRHS